MCEQIDLGISTAGKTPAFLFRTRKIHNTEASETLIQTGKRKAGNKTRKRDKNNEKYKLKDRGRKNCKEKKGGGKGR
jgi:hypothetical protein